MMKRRLLITSTDLMMVQFLIPHVLYLCDFGYDIEIACSNVGGRLSEVKSLLAGKVDTIYEIRLKRNPLSVSNVQGLQELSRLFQTHVYDIIWTNEPVMGAATRLAARHARRAGTKVVYMVHGFHFYKGAPLINWIVFYPIEHFLSRFTDIIVTINQEDRERAHHFPCEHIEYIHGIGLDISRLNVDKVGIRSMLGIPSASPIIISVGELNANKNHTTVIKALAEINDKTIHYIICGKGHMLPRLQALVVELGLNYNVHFLGYRRDVINICSESDVFIMPSFREGLGLAAIEAMYVGLPIITSNRHGLNDLNDGDRNGRKYDPDDVEGFVSAISCLLSDKDLRKRMGEENKKKATDYYLENTKNEILSIFTNL